MTEEEDFDPWPTRRQKAHDHLDLYLNLLVAGEEKAITSDSQQDAIYLFQLAMGYIHTVIGHELFDAALPWHRGNSPSELRQELLDLLLLVHPVWGANSDGPADIYAALEKLNVGETPPVFEPSKIGAGKHKWTERRYQFLAVIWAIHLQHGKVNGAQWANEVVAHAFDPAIARETPNAFSGLPQSKLRGWRLHIKKVAAGKIVDPALSRTLAERGINFAEMAVTDPDHWRMLWGGVLKSDYVQARIARRFHSWAFGCDQAFGSNSIVEAGQWYREFIALKESDYEAKRKRVRRAKKLQVNEKL